MGTNDANMQTHQLQDACAWHHQIRQEFHLQLARRDVERSKSHIYMSIGSALFQLRPNAAEGKPLLKGAD